jgi:hypothetical protein
MAGLTDSVTIGIVLTLIFGAVAFYLYSRLAQNEKRVGLLENLLMTLKLSTEASLLGPEFVEPISNPASLDTNDIEEVGEGEYADLLKGLGGGEANSASKRPPTPVQEEAAQPEEDLTALLRSMDTSTTVPSTAAVATEPPTRRTMDANYESMSLKELGALAKERGLTGVANRKRDLIDALKKQGEAVPTAPVPLAPAADELEGADQIPSGGFTVSLENA